MKLVYKNDNRPWIIGYSGGKDSTVVVQLAFTMLESLSPKERHKPIYVVSSDTLIENPIVLGYLKEASQLINEGAKAKGLPLYSEMVHPDYNNTFWTNIIGKGLPTPTSIRFRWCTERLKIKPSNTFIEEKVKENGEVIVLLGVRKAESIARKIRIENRAIDGYLLTPHGSLQNTYVYNPIVDYTTDDVWKTLLSNNGVTPWGGDNNELFALYAGSDAGECPFTITKNDKGEVDSPSCGNSRFGCWICTVVNEDKKAVAEILTEEAVEKAGYDSLDAAKEEGTAFVFMGHGTSHTAKISYSQMQSQMTSLGYDNVFIGTVEGEPEDTSCESVIEKVSAAGYKNVILRPLMVVAGDHANNDMAGSDDDSWLSQFKASGKFDKIDTQINGLGEIEGIQKLYVEHTAAAMSK